MFTSFSEAKGFIEKENVEILDLKYTDLNGRWRHISLPAGSFSQELLEKGVGFDGSGVGFAKAHSSDSAVIVPDLSTAALDPFWERKTLSFICDIVETISRTPFLFDPRSVAKKAEEYLSHLGWVDKSFWSPEAEFNIFDKVSFSTNYSESRYQIYSSESAFGSCDLSSGCGILPGEGYHAIPPADTLYNLRSEISANLELMGVEIKYHHHEGGGAGQVEIEIPMGGLVKTADTFMLIKYVAKMTARKWGKSVTFMPKPIYGDHGSGMHVHQTLWKAERNLFFDQKSYGGLSDSALFYIAGLLDHSPALLALTNPSTNSYRRLIPGFNAPTNLFFSLGSRTAAIRIPKYATSEESKRIEYRPPDATCNIYFCLSAQLMAGLDGIEHKTDPSSYGPFDDDIYTLPEEDIKNIKSLPTSFDQALSELKCDHDFLLQGDIFSQELIESWIEFKTKRELIPIQEVPHPYEFNLYYDV